MRKETVLQYLLRGGRIQRIPPVVKKPARKIKVGGDLEYFEVLGSKARGIAH